MNLRDLTDDQLRDLRMDLESAVECGVSGRDAREALLWLVREEQNRREIEGQEAAGPYGRRSYHGFAEPRR